MFIYQSQSARCYGSHIIYPCYQFSLSLQWSLLSLSSERQLHSGPFKGTLWRLNWPLDSSALVLNWHVHAACGCWTLVLGHKSGRCDIVRHHEKSRLEMYSETVCSVHNTKKEVYRTAPVTVMRLLHYVKNCLSRINVFWIIFWCESVLYLHIYQNHWKM